MDDNKQYIDFYGIRLLRMSTGIRYTGCIHERWVYPNGDAPHAMMLSNTWLKHDGYAYVNKAAEKAKHDRNLALLKKKLAADPEDMQTLVECIDITKHDAECIEYARRVMEVAGKKPPHWDKFGPVVYRGAVSVAKLKELPELRDWISQAVAEFPNSIFMRVDVAYFAFADYFNAGDYDEAVRWGTSYLRALSSYRTGKYDHSELLRGALDYVSPFWERRAYILLSHAYMECGKYGEAFHALQNIRGEDIEEVKQVESVTNMMMRLHRIATQDTSALAAAFWEQINQPVPNEEWGQQRRDAFLRTARVAFSEKYRKDEAEREDFLRYSYTMFAALDGRCALGSAVAMLETEDPALLKESLAGVEDWNELPVAIFAHALTSGMAFPLPDRPMNIEAMDKLAGQLARETDILDVLRQTVENPLDNNPQFLAWSRGLAMAAVRTFKWKAEGSDIDRGMNIARLFAQVEDKFLPLYYSPSVLATETLSFLPPLHRFGWYCAQAFGALDAGDEVNYVRLLREGLTVCENMKDMVEFLVEHTSQLQTQSEPSTELRALAEQIRTVLANFAPNDPAVVALKQSEAYQKVAYLIEGASVPVVGGLLQ